jgi:CRISPR-associated protein Cmr4
MYFPWGLVTQENGKNPASQEGTAQPIAPGEEFKNLMGEAQNSILQIGGQESLGRGFVQQWMPNQSVSQRQEVTA